MRTTTASSGRATKNLITTRKTPTMSSHQTDRKNRRRVSLVEPLETRTLLTTFPPSPATAFQSAINSSQLGDTIVLQAGTTYTGWFTLPNKTTGSGWVTITSSALASLPAAGVRVS